MPGLTFGVLLVSVAVTLWTSWWCVWRHSRSTLCVWRWGCVDRRRRLFCAYGLLLSVRSLSVLSARFQAPAFWSLRPMSTSQRSILEQPAIQEFAPAAGVGAGGSHKIRLASRLVCHSGVCPVVDVDLSHPPLLIAIESLRWRSCGWSLVVEPTVCLCLQGPLPQNRSGSHARTRRESWKTSHLALPIFLRIALLAL